MSAADDRRRVADRVRAELAEARAALPPGATAYAVITTTDRTGLRPPARRYVGRYPGKIGWHPPAGFDPNDGPAGDMPPGPWKSPMDAFGFFDTRVYRDRVECVHYRSRRYETHHSDLSPYNPVAGEQLDARRRARERKTVEAEAEDNPLFAEQIRAEGNTGCLTPRRGEGRGTRWTRAHTDLTMRRTDDEGPGARP